jgi:FkbM family methyltransferase
MPDDLPPLPPAPTVFDVGANIGLFSLHTLHERRDARVWAFEPVPEVCRALVHNLAPHPQAHACQLALGRFPGRSTLFYYPGFTMMSGLRADPEYDRAVARTYLASAAADGDASTGPGYAAENLASAADELLADRFDSATVSCGMDSVTGAMRRFGVDHLDLLKIDVERYELDVLLGIDEQTWAAINRVVVEVDDRVGELGQVLQVLRDAGMRCEARQAADYRGTSLSMVHAMR